MKISIVTVCYNSEATIEEAIKSVLSQDYPNIEYVMVDGGSKDGTLSIINKYKNHIGQFVSEPDRGVYDALNKGIRMATGDFVGILHSDDLFADNTVISQVVEKLKESKADTLYADLNYVNREDPSKIKRKWISGPYVQGLFRKGWMPPHPTFFVKRTVYLKNGLYRTQLEQSADYELMLRYLHKQKISTTYLNKVIVKMRVGGKSNVTLKNRIKANLEDRFAWKMNELNPDFATLYRKPLSKLNQFVPSPNFNTTSTAAYPFLLVAHKALSILF